jgi:acetyl esterase
MPLDPDVSAYLARLAALGVPPMHELSPEEARRSTEVTAAELFGPTDPVGAVVDRVLPGPLRVRIYEPLGNGDERPALVYFHGGGWVVGSLDTHDGVCRALCARTPCVVVSVDYRLAPEHRFPAAVEDAWAATAWVAEHARSLRADPARVAVGGDSAGGTLAAVVALRARDRGLRLALQLLVYPVTDRDLDRPSYLAHAEGYGLTREAMRWFWNHYLGPDGDPTHPEATPLRAADLRGVAPAHVITVELDPLRDEGEAYAERLREAGVAVSAVRADGLIHGCFRMPGTLPRANELLDSAAAALRAAFGEGFPQEPEEARGRGSARAGAAPDERDRAREARPQP